MLFFYWIYFSPFYLLPKNKTKQNKKPLPAVPCLPALVFSGSAAQLPLLQFPFAAFNDQSHSFQDPDIFLFLSLHSHFAGICPWVTPEDKLYRGKIYSNFLLQMP